MPDWSRRAMPEFVDFVRALNEQGIYWTALLDTRKFAPKDYRGTEMGFLAGIWRTWNPTTLWTQFWIKRWPKLLEEAEAYCAKQDEEKVELEVDPDQELPPAPCPNLLDFDAAGETADVDLGSEFVVKINVDESSMPIRTDQFGKKPKNLPREVHNLVKTIYAAPTNSYNMPKKSWLADQYSDQFDKRRNNCHDSSLRRCTVEQLGMGQDVWDYLTATTAHHDPLAQNIAIAKSNDEARLRRAKETKQVRVDKGSSQKRGTFSRNERSGAENDDPVANGGASLIRKAGILYAIE